jgi:hypothetical protein
MGSPRRRVGRINSRERRREWIDPRATQNAQPEVASRAGSEVGHAVFSLRESRDASLRSFRDPS